MSEPRMKANVDAFKAYAKKNGWKVKDGKQLPAGIQLIVINGTSETYVNFYTTGKIIPQGKTCKLLTNIKAWVEEQLNPPKNVTPSPDQSYQARYFVTHDQFAQIRDLLGNLDADVEINDLDLPDQVYRADIRRDTMRLFVTQYDSGLLYLHGTDRPLFDTTCKTLERFFKKAIAEAKAATQQPIPKSEPKPIASYLRQSAMGEEIVRWVDQGVGQELFNFLAEKDRITLLSGVELFFDVDDDAWEWLLKAFDYSIFVMPFARVFEGFVIQLALSLGIDEAVAVDESGQYQVHKYLNAIENKLERIHIGIADRLQGTLRDIRNQVMHSDPRYPLVINNFEDARHEIYSVIRAMRRGYDELIKNGIINSD